MQGRAPLQRGGKMKVTINLDDAAFANIRKEIRMEVLDETLAWLEEISREFRHKRDLLNGVTPKIELAKSEPAPKNGSGNRRGNVDGHYPLVNMTENGHWKPEFRETMEEKAPHFFAKMPDDLALDEYSTPVDKRKRRCDLCGKVYHETGVHTHVRIKHVGKEGLTAEQVRTRALHNLVTNRFA